MADFIGGLTFKRGDGATPTEAFTKVNGLKSLSGFGVSKPLVDVTDFDSTAREYIAGLDDGVEITAEFNDDLDATTGAELASLITDVDAGTVRNVQIVSTDGTNTNTYDFAVVGTGYTHNPSFDNDPNTVSISMKITGAITKS